MAVTNYYSIAGEVIAERTAGSARVDYLTDALGSITATVNQSAQVVNTYRYKPAGAQLAKTGTGPDPAFGWAGYLPTQKRFSEHYLRGRHVSDLIGVFTAKDQFISAVSPYAYALNNPVLFTDPMGWAPCQAPPAQQPTPPVQAPPKTGPDCFGTNPPAKGTEDYCTCSYKKCSPGLYFHQNRCSNGTYDCVCCSKGQMVTLCPGDKGSKAVKCEVGALVPPIANPTPPTPAPPKAGTPPPGEPSPAPGGAGKKGGFSPCVGNYNKFQFPKDLTLLICPGVKAALIYACVQLEHKSPKACCEEYCPAG